MQLNKKLITGMIIGTFIGVSASVSLNVFAFKDSANKLPLAQLRTFSEVYARIKKDYVEKVDDKELITSAIKGMLTGLDPHSAYLDETDFTELQVGTSGEFGGLGIEVGMEDGFVKVISPIDDTPAKEAGIEPGDLIIRLDDLPVKGMTLGEAVKIMRGKPGSTLALTVVREGKDKPFKIKIVRAIIKIQSVKSRLLEADYGYLRITSFQSKTTIATEAAVKALIKENKKALSGLILDLRNNPGGVLNAAVGVSDVFLEKGEIVHTKGRVKNSETNYPAQPGDALQGAPLIVLVNQGSASASEIVSGALQDHKRALIVGKKTFGKGSVQTVLPLGEKTALKLTTARYFTPLGRSIQAEGIQPDVIVDALKIAKTKKDDEIKMLSEADLSRHLDNPKNGKTEDKKTATKDETKKIIQKDDKDKKDTAKKEEQKFKPLLAEEDYQLFEALNILKGMNLIQTRLENKKNTSKTTTNEKDKI